VVISRRRQGETVRRMILLATILLVGMLVAGGVEAKRAHSQQIAYPVTITIKLRKAERANCRFCQAYYGRVSSPKPACERGRQVEGALRYRADSAYGGTTYEDNYGTTDSQGGWEHVFLEASEPLAWVRASVEAKRLGSGESCQPARGIYRYG
jgi:hypothetical protein